MRQSATETTTSATDAKRFAFGRNWRRFVRLVDDQRIAAAEASLCEMLAVRDLAGRTFVDVGSGSGLFSLAAHRLGAHVHSFDVDDDSVACASKLRERFGAGGSRWTVDRGSVLDRQFLAGLGRFDIVYSWGVLHHTGAMWQALENVKSLVADHGALFIAIYNDQKLLSRMWTAVKRAYVSGPVGRAAVLATLVPLFASKSIVRRVVRGGGDEGAAQRGMSVVVDWIDWFGGYPFEVASPEQIVDFYCADGFALSKLRTVGFGHGNNQFVFRRG